MAVKNAVCWCRSHYMRLFASEFAAMTRPLSISVIALKAWSMEQGDLSLNNMVLSTKLGPPGGLRAAVFSTAMPGPPPPTIHAFTDGHAPQTVLWRSKRRSGRRLRPRTQNPNRSPNRLLRSRRPNLSLSPQSQSL